MSETPVLRPTPSDVVQSHLEPGERVLFAFLLLATLLFLSGGAPVRDAFRLHAAITAGFVLVTLARSMVAHEGWRDAIGATATVAVILTLYSSLAEPAFVLMGGSRDTLLAAVDRVLFFGVDPAYLVPETLSRRAVEAWSVVYGWFIPFLYLSIFLGCYGRPTGERREFLSGLTITYCVAYLGYLFVPARGPIELYPFPSPLDGGSFHALVLRGVEATGGNHGAFPSLHVGATAYLCLFDLRRNRLRGLTYVPLVILISLSTVVLRYHYVVDVLVGLLVAFVADRVAARGQKTEAP